MANRKGPSGRGHKTSLQVDPFLDAELAADAIPQGRSEKGREEKKDEFKSVEVSTSRRGIARGFFREH